MTNSILSNPWIIAAATFIATVIAAPLASRVWRYIRSLSGIYSGQYLAFTGDPKNGHVLVEDVMVRQVGNRIAGKIFGVAVLIKNQKTGHINESLENKGKYRFSGFVSDGVLLISYFTRIRGLRSAGNITLKDNTAGMFLSGVWSGVVHDPVESSPCSWLKLRPRISTKSARSLFIVFARDMLEMAESITLGTISKTIVPLGISQDTIKHYIREMHKNKKLK
jgi:hypothetical protein